MRWIVGDIHGMLASLRALVGEVRKRDPLAKWIFVGDYVNRGPDSKGVIDLLLKLPNARFCRGNHDDIFDFLVNGRCFVEQLTQNNRPAAYKWFMSHGLMETFLSYGAEAAALDALLDNPSDAGLDALMAKVPPAHKKFLRELVPAVEEPDLFVTHARWDPATPDEDPGLLTYLEVDQDLRKTATWGRFSSEELDAPKSWRRRGFFGHTPVDTYGVRGGYDPRGGGQLRPIVGEKLILLDTAAALSPAGRLTAYCPEKSNYVQADRQGNIVE